MIKKNTKIVFKDGRQMDEAGGIPLSEGEKLTMHSDGVVKEYVVVKKTVDCFDEGVDQIVNITYVLE